MDISYLEVMFDPANIIEKAKTSSLYLNILNWSLNRMIPFNKPHGFRILEITNHSLKTKIPYIKKNLNHIKGLHACALATVSEFTTGLMLLTRLGKQYRIIMQRLEMDYHYQGKTDAFAKFEVTDEWIAINVNTPLKANDSVVVVCEVMIHDANNHHLTTGRVHWQIKNWNKVKTKL
jgi:acyl-coenzyme A thioesterase PaaI-like protein